MTSVDVGLMMHKRDRKRATQLYRTQSLGKSPVYEPDGKPGGEELGQFEPDWSKFESVFARGTCDRKGYLLIM